MKLLMDGWNNADLLAVLALAQWGAEHGISVETPDRETSTDALDQVLLVLPE
jgi:hypothetical protein